MLWPSTCLNSGMEKPYSELLFQYRLTLAIWIEARDKFGLQDKETISSALRLEQLKAELDDRRRLARGGVATPTDGPQELLPGRVQPERNPGFAYR